MLLTTLTNENNWLKDINNKYQENIGEYIWNGKRRIDELTHEIFLNNSSKWI